MCMFVSTYMDYYSFCCLSKIFMHMGLPEVVTSDNGTEFNNELNTNLMKRLGIKRCLITPYHPQVCIFFVP